MVKVTRYVDEDGNEYWKKLDGQYHREDGPAVIHTDGTQFWYRHNMWHREDGPAIIYGDGDTRWYIDDCEYSFEVYCLKLNVSPEQLLELKLKYG